MEWLTPNKMMREMMEVQSQLIFPIEYSNFIVGERMSKCELCKESKDYEYYYWHL